MDTLLAPLRVIFSSLGLSFLQETITETRITSRCVSTCASHVSTRSDFSVFPRALPLPRPSQAACGRRQEVVRGTLWRVLL